MTGHGQQGMRESFRWTIIGLLVISLVGFTFTTWQVRKLRWSVNYMQGQLDLQSVVLKYTKDQLALTIIERDGFHDAYDKLKFSLQPPVVPAPPPGPRRREPRPVPTFSRDSQFSAKPRRRFIYLR